MRVVLFGATGMIGGGVLRECLLDSRVASVLAVGRASCGQRAAKLTEVVASDLFELSGVAERLRGADACFYCLGVSSAGMSEAAYTRVTYDLTLSIARALLAVNARTKMCFVSGRERTAARRVQPLHGIAPRAPQYRMLYAAFRPLWPVLHGLAPNSVTTTERIGRAMLQVALAGSAKRVLGSRDINAAAAALPPARA